MAENDRELNRYRSKLCFYGFVAALVAGLLGGNEWVMRDWTRHQQDNEREVTLHLGSEIQQVEQNEARMQAEIEMLLRDRNIPAQTQSAFQTQPAPKGNEHPKDSSH